MFCMFCGAEITTSNPVFCSRCGRKLATDSETNANELSFANPSLQPGLAPPPEARPPPRPLPEWNYEALRCPPYTFGPHFHKYKIHGTWNAPDGKVSGDVALTLTGFEFTSKAGDIRIYYPSIVRAEKTSSSTIVIETNDAHSYEFKLAVPNAWIEKIGDMSYLSELE